MNNPLHDDLSALVAELDAHVARVKGKPGNAAFIAAVGSLHKVLDRHSFPAGEAGYPSQHDVLARIFEPANQPNVKDIIHAACDIDRERRQHAAQKTKAMDAASRIQHRQQRRQGWWLGGIRTLTAVVNGIRAAQHPRLSPLHAMQAVK